MFLLHHQFFISFQLMRFIQIDFVPRFKTPHTNAFFIQGMFRTNFTPPLRAACARRGHRRKSPPQISSAGELHSQSCNLTGNFSLHWSLVLESCIGVLFSSLRIWAYNKTRHAPLLQTAVSTLLLPPYEAASPPSARSQTCDLWSFSLSAAVKQVAGGLGKEKSNFLKRK